MAHAVEFCGGTHLDRSGQAGHFALVSEEGVAASRASGNAAGSVPPPWAMPRRNTAWASSMAVATRSLNSRISVSAAPRNAGTPSPMNPIGTPLVFSGFPAGVIDMLRAPLAPAGLLPVQGGSNGRGDGQGADGIERQLRRRKEPGIIDEVVHESPE